jgi:hypothetical protein
MAVLDDLVTTYLTWGSGSDVFSICKGSTGQPGGTSALRVVRYWVCHLQPVGKFVIRIQVMTPQDHD